MPEERSNPMTTQNSELEANLFLDVIVAHMAYLEAQDIKTKTEARSSFVEAIKVLYRFLCEPNGQQDYPNFPSTPAV